MPIFQIKRSKLDDKGEKCIFLGVSDQSKAYKLYNPTTKKIIISRDVVFYEERFWENNIDETNQNLANFDEELRTRLLEEQQISAITVEDERPQRARRRHAWMSDYKVTEIEDPITYFALFSYCDPTTFESAVKEEKRRKAMDDEIDSIKRNDTWNLCDLPNGHNIIRVKWVFKTKLKENGEVDKYKARLVAKGYKQQYGVDYT